MRRTDILAGIDTSFVVRLLTGDPEPLAASARRYLAKVEAKRAAVAVSNLVISEAYFACQHHYRMPKEAVFNALESLLSQPTFFVQSDVLNLLRLEHIAAAQPGFLDRPIHAEYANRHLRLVTFEKSAAKLAKTQVLGEDS